MIDLSTTYMGLKLKNPIVASASPLCDSLDNIRRLEDHGIAAVVLPSLFEEQITHDEFEVDRVLSAGTESFAEALDYFPELDDYNTGPGEYLEHVAAAKEALYGMCKALGRGMHMIALALAPSEIVVVGDITTQWCLAGPAIEAEMRRYPLVRTPRLRPAQEGSKARLRSAVALVMNANQL